MIIRDGICYPDVPARHVKIVGAENVGDHLLRVRFEDGEIRLFLMDMFSSARYLRHWHLPMLLQTGS